MTAVRSASLISSITDGRQMGGCRELLWNFLDDPESSKAASWYALLTPIFILITVGVGILQTVEPPIFEKRPAAALNVVIEALFALELLLRFITCPSRIAFFLDWHNLMDFLAISPLFLRAAVNFEIPDGQGSALEDIERNLLLGFVPVLRLMKTIRRFERFRLLVTAFELCFEALPICLFSLLMLTLIFSALIFLVEPRDNIDSLPEAMWLTIVTMTTVGYGDKTPQSPAGSLIVTVLVITSVLYMAMPLGIIGQAFTQVWGERDRVLLMSRTKERLVQWGYKAHDIPALFEWFDMDQDGALDLTEFLQMMREMRIGLTERRMIELFQSFDNDGSGSIDDREFVKALFPGSYGKIYNTATESERENNNQEHLDERGSIDT